MYNVHVYNVHVYNVHCTHVSITKTVQSSNMPLVTDTVQNRIKFLALFLDYKFPLYQKYSQKYLVALATPRTCLLLMRAHLIPA